MQFGNLTRGCVTAGAHYNPTGKSHGDLADYERHVGDMGNITSKGQVAEYSATDRHSLIMLSGPSSVVGRAVVVHADPDDLGKGNAEDSKTTGHAGARVSAASQHHTHTRCAQQRLHSTHSPLAVSFLSACGVIAVDKP